jgi:2-iminobutanoate/2-iminopropanoate deaminase
MEDFGVKFLESSKTPKAIGPYSKGTKVRISDEKSLIYTSGSIGVNPETGDLVSSDVGEQTRQALENLKNLLE